MNKKCDHQIAIENEQLDGYALMAPRKFGRNLPILIPFFDCIDEIE